MVDSGTAAGRAMVPRVLETAPVVVAGLLLLAVVPGTFAMSWTAKAAVALLIIGPGIAALVIAAVGRDRAAWAGLAFVVIAGLSTALSPAPVLALVGMYNHGTGWLFVAAVVGMWALGRRASASTARVFGSVILIAAFVNAVMVWLQSSRSLTGDLYTMVDGRPPALLGNPVHASALFLGAFALVAQRWHSDRSDPTARRYATLYLGLAVLLASALQLAGGRIGLGMLVVVFGALTVHVGWRGFLPTVLPIIAAAVIGVLAAVVVSPGGGEVGAASRLSGGGDSPLSGRIDRWKLAVPAVEARPLLGEGPGLFRRATSPHNTAAAARAFGPDTLNIDAHNVFVEYLVTTGVLGAAAFSVWLIVAAKGARGELAWFAAFGAVSLLLQPQFVGLTPVLACALGAAKRAPPVRYPRVASVAVTVAVVAGLVLGVAMVAGDHRLYRTVVDLRPADGRAATRLLKPWPQPVHEESRAYQYSAISHRQPSDWRRAIAAARTAVARDPSDPGSALALAALALAHGTRADARIAYDHALRWNPYSVQALVGRASMAARDGDRALVGRLCARVAAVTSTVKCPNRALSREGG